MTAVTLPAVPRPVLSSVARVPVRLRQFVGWFVLGVVAFGAEVGVLGALHQWLGCPLWLASALAAETVLLGRFLSTDRLGHRWAPLARVCSLLAISCSGRRCVHGKLARAQRIGNRAACSVRAGRLSGQCRGLWVERPDQLRVGVACSRARKRRERSRGQFQLTGAAVEPHCSSG
jgi:hypothetical protein